MISTCKIEQYWILHIKQRNCTYVYAYTCTLHELNNHYLSITFTGSDGSGGEDGESEGKERSLKTQQEHLEAEKQALLQNKELLDEVG